MDTLYKWVDGPEYTLWWDPLWYLCSRVMIGRANENEGEEELGDGEWRWWGAKVRWISDTDRGKKKQRRWTSNWEIILVRCRAECGDMAPKGARRATITHPWWKEYETKRGGERLKQEKKTTVRTGKLLRIRRIEERKNGQQRMKLTIR